MPVFSAFFTRPCCAFALPDASARVAVQEVNFSRSCSHNTKRHSPPPIPATTAHSLVSSVCIRLSPMCLCASSFSVSASSAGSPSCCCGSPWPAATSSAYRVAAVMAASYATGSCSSATFSRYTSVASNCSLARASVGPDTEISRYWSRSACQAETRACTSLLCRRVGIGIWEKSGCSIRSGSSESPAVPTGCSSAVVQDVEERPVGTAPEAVASILLDCGFDSHSRLL
mmetsp:Transcript_26952/g.67896  ORF Transcript_26952/g.67896 Transcript_26952/m.67896 type:complete len:229 (+) Transcript_26952:2836-3522(+)